jgi:hypothetical protein
MISPSACTSYNCLGNMRVHLGNVRALLLYCCSQIFLYSRPMDSGETRGGARALRTGRRGLELWDVWWRRSPPEQGGRVQSCGTHGDIGAPLPQSREEGSGATGHTVALEPSCASVVGCGTVGHTTTCGCTPCFLPWLRACTRGYPVHRVPTTLSRINCRKRVITMLK